MMMNQHEPLNATRMPVKRPGIWFFLPLFVVLLVVFILAARWRDSLTVQEVKYSGLRVVAETDAKTWAAVPMNKPLFGLNLSNIADRIAAQSYVKHAAVYREFPDAVCVDITEREPFASLNRGQMYFVDDECVLLPYIHPATRVDVPVISGIAGIQNARAGEIVLSNELYQAIEILKLAREIDTSLYRMISEVNMGNGGDVTLTSVEGAIPIILGRDDYGKKLVTFRTFWTTVAKEQSAGSLQSVDLRYEDQVVVRWDHKTERLPRKASL